MPRSYAAFFVLLTTEPGSISNRDLAKEQKTLSGHNRNVLHTW